MTDPALGKNSWTDERIALLTTLRSEGTMKRGEMADHINFQTGSEFTRSGVCGKIDRLFPIATPKRTLEERAAVKRARQDRRNDQRREEGRQRRLDAGLPANPDWKRAAQRRRDPGLKVVFRAEEVAAANVHGIVNLEDHHCRFMTNDDCANPVFCGGQVAAGKSWRFNHCAIVFAPPSERRRSAA